MKITNKDVYWNYVGYGIMFGVNIIILPLVLKYLTTDELGLWYVYSSIGALITLFDFGFAPQIARTVTYAFSGAETINKSGIQHINKNSGPNFKLLNEITQSSKLLYFLLAAISLLLLASIGSAYIHKISKVFFNKDILLSWIIYVIGCFVNINYSYYNSIFRGLGKFVELNKAIVVSRGFQLVISTVLLLLGYGILAVSIAYTINTIIFRVYLHFAYNKIEKAFIKLNGYAQETLKLFSRFNFLKIMWHNAWRDGLVTVSNYIVAQSSILICSIYFGLASTASYALSVQIITFITSLSTILFGTIQPMLVEASLKNNIELKKKYFSFSWSFFFVSFLVLSIGFYLLGIPLLALIKSNTQIDKGIFIFYAIFMLFTTNFNLSASYISSSNVIPYAKPFTISAFLSILLALMLAKYTELNVWGLILAHFIIQVPYNFWKWPLIVMREIKANPIDMLGMTIKLLKTNIINFNMKNGNYSNT